MTDLEKAQQIITRWCNGEYTNTIEETQDMVKVKRILDALVLALTRKAVSQTVRELLDDGKWPEYRAEDDRGLEHGEYVNFILHVLALSPVQDAIDKTI